MLMPAALVRLLMVEDHAPLRTLFEVFLRHQGYAVQVVASLHAAQSLFATQVFDLLVVELGPSTSAEPFGTLEAVRDQISPTPVLLLSRSRVFPRAGGSAAAWTIPCRLRRW